MESPAPRYCGLMPDQPELTVADATAWREWLVQYHGDQIGIWLVLAKKGTTEPTSLRYQEALLEALCFGWIDGQMRSRDTATMFQRFTPRRARSMWSKRNIGIVALLTEEGRMHPNGVAEVDRAKADGRWDAAYRQAETDLPDDLARAISAVPAASAMLEVLTKQNKFAMAFRLQQLKRPETRVRRVGEYVEMLARGETIHPQKRLPS